MKPKSRRQFLTGMSASCVGSILVNNFKLNANATSNQLVNLIISPPSTPSKSREEAPKVPEKPNLAPKQPVSGGWYGRFAFTEDQAWGNTEGVHASVSWRVIGHTEGNLSPTGETQGNYSGHVDPGNDVWNRGAYSYQFGNEENLSPEESDKRQHKKIKDNYYACVDSWAKKEKYTAEEVLNFMDMLNQAPLCVTSSQGNMMQRLDEAKKSGKTGYDAILDARVKSFINPSTGGYDTNFVSEKWLIVDQKRRMDCIVAALPQKIAELQGKSTPMKVSFTTDTTKTQSKESINKKPTGSKFDRIPRG